MRDRPFTVIDGAPPETQRRVARRVLRETPKRARDVLSGCSAPSDAPGGEAVAWEQEARAWFAGAHVRFRCEAVEMRAAHLTILQRDADEIVMQEHRRPGVPRERARQRLYAQAERKADAWYAERMAPAPVAPPASEAWAKVIGPNRAEVGCSLPGGDVVVTVTGDLAMQARALVWAWMLTAEMPDSPSPAPDVSRNHYSRKHPLTLTP